METDLPQSEDEEPKSTGPLRSNRQLIYTDTISEKGSVFSTISTDVDKPKTFTEAVNLEFSEFRRGGILESSHLRCVLYVKQ